MNRIQADKLRQKAYCEQCPGKSPVIRFGPDRSYVVECPTDSAHELTVAKSQFSELMASWRRGERLMGLQGLIFTNTLRVLQRKNPERWDYEEDGSGHVLRIGKEYRGGEAEMSQALTVQEYTPQQMDIIRTQLAPEATEEQFNYFMAVAFRSGLDPLRKQIYPLFFKKKSVKVGEKWVEPKEKDMAIVTGIDGFRATAAKTREHAGTDDPVYGPVDEDGFPEWCRVTTYRIVQGQRVPFTATVRWDEFAFRTYRDNAGKVQRVVKDEYAERPFNQLGVRAETHALRKGFPVEMDAIELRESHVRVSDERPEVDVLTGEIIDATPQPQIPAPAPESSHSAPEAENKGPALATLIELSKAVYGLDYAAEMRTLMKDMAGVESSKDLTEVDIASLTALLNATLDERAVMATLV